ncbi:MAG: hypothetical protein ICV68_00545 [Pyrinomonadaceae bacterium]|nr:hypothetical protein [Pyrinomonadaceae bacterium]
MAEDRTLAIARAADTTGDDDITKEELQRRMEQARETITQTVTEIKDTVANQYQTVKETISETLDWREQFRKRPVAWSVGALSVGFMTGYCIAASVKGDGGGRSRREGYPSAEETDVWNVSTSPAASYYQGGAGSRAVSSPARSYAAQAITGGAYGSTEYAEGQADSGALATSGASTGGEAVEDQPLKPGLIDRFKETKAFDRLQDEVSKLGDRFIEQLSTVGQEVVLPALFGKVRELFGVDLSNQKQGQGTSGGRTRAAAAGASSSSSSLADASRDSQTAAGVSDMGGLSTDTGKQSSSSGSSDASRDDYGRSSSGSANPVPNNMQ